MPTPLEHGMRLVHKDARGEMYVVELPEGEMLLLFSRSGALRGGHSHTIPEVITVLSGKMRYHKIEAGEERTVLLTDGDSSFNAADVVHMGEFLEDTWLIEWKIGARRTGWKDTNYEPWRAKVRASAGI